MQLPCEKVIWVVQFLFTCIIIIICSSLWFGMILCHVITLSRPSHSHDGHLSTHLTSILVPGHQIFATGFYCVFPISRYKISTFNLAFVWQEGIYYRLSPSSWAVIVWAKQDALHLSNSIYIPLFFPRVPTFFTGEPVQAFIEQQNSKKSFCSVLCKSVYMYLRFF